MTEIEDRLRDYGQRWRSDQGPPPPIDDRRWQTHSRKRSSGGSRTRIVVAVLGAACLLAVGAVGVTLNWPSGADRQNVVAGGDRPEPLAGTGGPLLTRLPPPSDLVLVTSGQAGGVAWDFYAKSSNPGADTYQVTDPPLPLQGGLCTAIRFKRDASAMEGVAAGTGPCGDPREMDAISLAGIGPGTGLDARILMGVTSVPAVRVRIAYEVGVPVIEVPTVSNPAFPGLRFFVTEVPAGRATHLVTVAADGTTLLEADPSVLPRFP